MPSRPQVTGRTVRYPHVKATAPSIDADLVVIFDNNAYRDLLPRPDEGADPTVKIKLVRELEAKKRVQALASPPVLVELVARLIDRLPLPYQRARDAIACLVHHCEMAIDGEAKVATLTDPISQLCLQLFGEEPSGFRSSTDQLVSFARQLAEELPGSLPDVHRAFVEDIAAFVAGQEAAFVEHFKQTAVKVLDPDNDGWSPLRDEPQLREKADKFFSSQEAQVAFAEMQVRQCASVLEKELSDAEIREQAEAFTEQLAVPASLFNEIARRIFTTGCDLTKRNRPNWLWDINLALTINPWSCVDEKPNLVVTSDADILAAAQSAGCGERVMPLDDYQRWLAYDPGTK